MTSRDWFKTEKLYENTFAIHGYTQDTVYLLVGDDCALLIDTGWGVCNLKNEIEKITSKPVLTVLTHGHLDHAGGAALFDKVYMNSIDKDVLSDMLSFKQKKPVIEHLIRKILPSDFNPDMYLSSNNLNTIPISDGYIFNLGNRDVEVISTPGHTKGSIMLFDKKKGLIFTGDNISSQQIWLHFDHSSSIFEYIESMEKLLSYKKYLNIFMTPHSFKVDISILDEILELSKNIISKKIKGEILNTYIGNGVMYKNKHLGIICKI